MTKAITTKADTQAEVIDSVIAKGDLAKLTPEERVSYYRNVCESVGLNPITRPFEYISLQGKLTLYARKDATDQLRRLHGVSVQIVSREIVNGVLVVVARATDKTGRFDEEIGAVSIAGLAGEAAANALMRGITKAKRRVTLSLCGLGFLDETEIETIKSARVEYVDRETGEILPPQLQQTKVYPKSDTITRKAIAALSLPDCDLLEWQNKVVKFCEADDLTQEDQLKLSVALNEVKQHRAKQMQEEAGA